MSFEDRLSSGTLSTKISPYWKPCYYQQIKKLLFQNDKFDNPEL
jgi:hypothetical protein